MINQDVDINIHITCTTTLIQAPEESKPQKPKLGCGHAFQVQFDAFTAVIAILKVIEFMMQHLG